MQNTNLKASFYTLGCRLNQAETALISDSFKTKGYDVVDYGQPTDLCVINTCTVTEQADSKCRQLVRQVLKRSPEAFVAVVGCYAQMASEDIKKIEGVDLIIGTEEKMQVSDFIDLPHKLPETIVRNSKIKSTPFTISSVGNYEHATRANLKIQDGCDFMCTFCIIPFARGRARCRAFWDIQREAMQLVERGHKELVLSGVNIGTYEFENNNLIDVIQMLEKIDGLERIRISSIEPTTIPYDLVDYMADSEKLCNHFHIPLQHGDEGILEKMRRLYNIREYTDFLNYVEKRVPNVCFGTDVMIGFPGEGEVEFEQTKKVLQELPFAYFHVFTFSERAGTPAVKMADKVDHKIKKQRSEILRQLSDKKKKQYFKQQIGHTLSVLMEERNESGLFQGFSENYVKVAVKSKDDLSNQMVDVLVRDVIERSLAVGDLVN